MSRRLKIVLASTSPRRKRLMGQLGIPFEVADPGEVDEVTSGRPEVVVAENAFAKASAVSERLEEGIVIGADTVVVKDGGILGKPSDSLEAEETLRALSGSGHRVLTGIAVIDAQNRVSRSDVVETRVRFLPLSKEEISAYVGTGEPLGKAGGYAIQGLGAVLVDEIHGSYYNVVGLPLSRLSVVLKEFDVHILAEKAEIAQPSGAS
jgi:septum formation protein